MAGNWQNKRRLCIGAEENTLQGMEKKDCAAVILAAGQGKRMQSAVPKPVSYTHLTLPTIGG